jgi:hypothetical protein
MLGSLSITGEKPMQPINRIYIYDGARRILTLSACFAALSLMGCIPLKLTLSPPSGANGLNPPLTLEATSNTEIVNGSTTATITGPAKTVAATLNPGPTSSTVSLACTPAGFDCTSNNTQNLVPGPNTLSVTTTVVLPPLAYILPANVTSFPCNPNITWGSSGPIGQCATISGETTFSYVQPCSFTLSINPANFPANGSTTITVTPNNPFCTSVQLTNPPPVTLTNSAGKVLGTSSCILANSYFTFAAQKLQKTSLACSFTSSGTLLPGPASGSFNVTGANTNPNQSDSANASASGTLTTN